MADMSAQDLLATIVFEQSPPPGFFWAGGSDREEEGQWTLAYDPWTLIVTNPAGFSKIL